MCLPVVRKNFTRWYALRKTLGIRELPAFLEGVCSFRGQTDRSLSTLAVGLSCDCDTEGRVRTEPEIEMPTYIVVSNSVRLWKYNF